MNVLSLISALCLVGLVSSPGQSGGLQLNTARRYYLQRDNETPPKIDAFTEDCGSGPSWSEGNDKRLNCEEQYDMSDHRLERDIKHIKLPSYARLIVHRRIDDATEDTIRYCGATVVHKDLLLASSTCIFGPGRVIHTEVEAGRWAGRYHEAVKPRESKRNSVREYCVSKVDSEFNETDFALLRLQAPLNYNRYLQPACLRFGNLRQDKGCLATGFRDIKRPRVNVSELPSATEHERASYDWCATQFGSGLCATVDRKVFGFVEYGSPVLCLTGCKQSKHVVVGHFSFVEAVDGYNDTYERPVFKDYSGKLQAMEEFVERCQRRFNAPR